MTDPIKISAFEAGAPDWRVVSDGACAFFVTSSLTQSVTFVAAIAGIANLPEHQYGIDLRQAGVTVRLVTLRDDFMGMTVRDLELAQQIADVAREQGLTADPSRIQSLLIVPGAPDIKKVTPFWQAVLGYVPRPDSPDEDLVDPYDHGNAFWFETMEEARPGGLGAIHLGMWVPLEEAHKRVDAALAAGGHLVRDDYAPSWWTLADAYGNEIDVGTSAYRDEPPPEN